MAYSVNLTEAQKTEVTKLIIVDRTEIFSVINIMLVISIFNLL